MLGDRPLRVDAAFPTRQRIQTNCPVRGEHFQLLAWQDELPVSWRAHLPLADFTMDAFFVSFQTSLSQSAMSYRRRKLADLLQERAIELQWLPVGKEIRPIITQLVMDARGTPVVVLDEQYPLPDDAPWLAELTAETIDFPDQRRPQLVYVTCGVTATGKAQMLQHPLLHACVERDDGTRWVEAAAESVFDLAVQQNPLTTPATAPPIGTPSEVVGVSPCFREAVAHLDQLIQSPYGLVTGEQGVGKLSLIRAKWREHRGNAPMIVLPCGSFFKDYYVSGNRRRFGGGREAVDQLTPFVTESHNGLLVLHHVEQLPTALQEELDVRLATATDNPDGSMRFAGIDSDGPVDYDLHLIATSTCEPDLLEQTGHVIPELIAKLRRRHVRIPSLVERGAEDVELICSDMLERISASQHLSVVPTLNESALESLSGTNWPANLTDLVRVLEYAVRRCNGNAIERQHLPSTLLTTANSNGTRTLDEIVETAQRTAIENTLLRTGGNVAQAAEILGRHKGTLHRLMKELGIKAR